MVLDESRFDAIVSGFYAAATGSIGWQDALTAVHEALGTRATVLHSVDLTTGRTVQLQHGGPAQHAGVLEYVRHWHERDPRRAVVVADPSLMLGRWFHCHEHFDAAFVARNDFYRHFLPAQQTRYLSTTATLVTPTLMTALALELPAERGPLTPDERHWCDRVAHHLGESLRIHERLRRLAAQALAGHALLGGLPYPMWLLDADRFVFHANPAAEAQTGDGAGLEIRDDRLFWRMPRIDRDFGVRLRELGHGQHGMRALIDARARASDPPIWLHLQTLAPERVLGAFGDRMQVLATLFDPTFMRELDPFALGTIFGLTPTEARVAVVLSEGLTAQAIADRVGCSLNTVRTHLRRVMEKLGAARLADAVRLLRQGEVLWAMPIGSGR